tara:strand:+ start:132 stop:1055 length:924 start_codon:yes stop_codon:yes gene_type:complete
MLKIAIVGSEGFIGRNLYKELELNNEFNIYCFGRGKTSILGHKNYKQIELNNISQNKLKFQSFDIIYYLVSATFPASSYNDPISELNLNLSPFLNFLESLKESKVKKIIFTSSGGSVYGSNNKKINESSLKLPASPHGITKLTMEFFLDYYQIRLGINYNIFRISNIYGEHQNTSKGLGLINTILEKIILEEKIKIYGNGSCVRNYIYVKDVAKVLGLSAKEDLKKSNIFNLSSSENLDINDLLKVIKKIVDKPFEIQYLPERSSDIASIKLDNRKLLKKYPKLKLTELNIAIKNTYNYLKSINSLS